MTPASHSQTDPGFPAPDHLPAQPALPDPLVMLDETRITTAEEWRDARAPELRRLFEHYEYGRRPADVPVTGKLLREDASAFGGRATLKEIAVDMGLPAPVHLLLLVPNGRTGPAPCFLMLGFTPNYTLLADPLVQKPRDADENLRGSRSAVWLPEQAIERGCAVAAFWSHEVVPDRRETAPGHLQHFGNPADGDGPATIMAWAWGFSRMIDVLQTDPGVDPRRIALVGHSRNGKAALVAAAFDERAALVIPSQAGCGGTAPCRPLPATDDLAKAETVAKINETFPDWFCGNFKAFGAAPEKLPFDQHALIALCAPRPVLLSCATEDLWANPAGQFEMLRAADPIYRLVAGDGLAEAMPPEPGRLLDSRLGYFIRPGKHSMGAEDWRAWLDYAGKWLR